MFNLSLLESEKIQNLMREGGKKNHLRKNIEPIFAQVNQGEEIKKHWANFYKS